ncbi:hypothetical protein M4I32_15010, partial [Microbacterium sp. LRZ72]|uniref:hypothetical protein n=1 Tax=Microbacterium sp. LRZ72 TaxID=2942481 RepID=UPI0029AD0D4D
AHGPGRPHHPQLRKRRNPAKYLTRDNRTKSFELFRGNSRAVSIVTFDEVLASLTLLRSLLTSEELDRSQGR